MKILQHAEKDLAILVNDRLTEEQIRQQMEVMGAPVAKAKLGKLLANKLAEVDGWTVILADIRPQGASTRSGTIHSSSRADLIGEVPEFNKKEVADKLVAIGKYEPHVKESKTEVYVTFRLDTARVQATVGMRGVTLMIFPLKGLDLKRIDAKKTGWQVQAQYVRVGSYQADEIAAKLEHIREVVEKASETKAA